MTKPNKRAFVTNRENDTFYRTIINSSQWKEWEIEQTRRFAICQKEKRKVWNGVYDMPECVECGWISQDHFQDFLKFFGA